MLRALLILPFLVLAPPAAAAQPLGELCSDAGTTPEIGACLDRALDAAEAELDAALQDVTTEIDSAEWMEAGTRRDWKDSMLAAQQSWRIFRNADCGVMNYEFWGGSGSGNFIRECMVRHTRTRIGDLGARYELTQATATTDPGAVLGLWATRPEGQIESVAEICRNQSFGIMEISLSKILEYESDCDVTSFSSAGGETRIESSCFAEGDSFTQILILRLIDANAMEVDSHIPEFRQRDVSVYSRCR